MAKFAYFFSLNFCFVRLNSYQQFGFCSISNDVQLITNYKLLKIGLVRITHRIVDVDSISYERKWQINGIIQVKINIFTKSHADVKFPFQTISFLLLTSYSLHFSPPSLPIVTCLLCLYCAPILYLSFSLHLSQWVCV